MLSPEERARAEAFHFKSDRERHIIGRGLLRLLLGHCSGALPSTLTFQHNAFGKPFLCGGSSTLQFNVSHSGELVVIALTRGRAVGIDVERIRPDMRVAQLATQFFSPNECNALASIPMATQAAAFFSCWTRKEAYLKARGSGLSLGLDQFDVSIIPGHTPQLLETRHDPADVSRWTIRDLQFGKDYKAALAVEGSNWRLKSWDWPEGLCSINAMSRSNAALLGGSR
jgi:4'-phosphopantetheinyl transferase